MIMLRPQQVTGDQIQLLRTNPMHLNSEGTTAPLDTTSSKGFAALLMEAMDGVSRSQNDAENLAITALTSPDSVDPQDVTIALSEATLALNITRTVFDRALSAYNNVINMR